MCLQLEQTAMTVTFQMKELSTAMRLEKGTHFALTHVLTYFNIECNRLIFSLKTMAEIMIYLRDSNGGITLNSYVSGYWICGVSNVLGILA